MDDLQTISEVQKPNLLICFYDIDNFSSVSRSKPDATEVFELLSTMAKITYAKIDGSSGHVVKFIGDAALLVFPESHVDEGVNLLLALKQALEEFFQSEGIAVRLRFSLHYGEAAIGPFGPEAHESLDVFGDNVNVAAALAKGQHRGRFIISPQVFRKLNPKTRKVFHKYTPPIVYLAD